MVGHCRNLPRYRGFDPDGNAETEADYFEKCLAAESGSIRAILDRWLCTFTMPRSRAKARSHRAKDRCNRKPAGVNRRA
jgi:hypothetical protein